MTRPNPWARPLVSLAVWSIVLVVIFMPRGIGGIIDDFFVRRRFKAIREARNSPKADPDVA